MDNYTVTQASGFFSRSPETVRLWCIEFADFLSPTANPGEGKTRLLTDDDMAVLALVHERKSQGVHSEDVIAELRQGTRGALPALTPQQLAAIGTSSEVERLTLEREALNGQIATLQALVTSLQTAKEEAVRLAAQLEASNERAARAEQELTALQNERRQLESQIRELSERAARAEGRLEEKDKPRRWRF